MACVPRIDSPCPLPAAEAVAVQGDCRHCGHAVHDLDVLDEAGRRALFATTNGRICVRYRMALPAALALGLGLSVIAPLEAAEPAKIIPSLTLAEPAAPQSSVVQKPLAVMDEDLEKDLEVILLGGIQSPQDAEWVDDTDLPPLPVIQG